MRLSLRPSASRGHFSPTDMSPRRHCWMRGACGVLRPRAQHLLGITRIEALDEATVPRQCASGAVARCANPEIPTDLTKPCMTRNKDTDKVGTALMRSKLRKRWKPNAVRVSTKKLRAYPLRPTTQHAPSMSEQRERAQNTLRYARVRAQAPQRTRRE